MTDSAANVTLLFSAVSGTDLPHQVTGAREAMLVAAIRCETMLFRWERKAVPHQVTGASQVVQHGASQWQSNCVDSQHDKRQGFIPWEVSS